MNYYAGIDLGGTKTYCVIIDEKGNILAREKMKIGTDKNIENVLDVVTECYKAAISRANLAENDIFAAGMAVPSAVNTDKQILLNAPNLGWKNIKIGEIMTEKLGKPVFVDNDVNLGTFGEYTFGKAKEYKNIYGIFVGTGVGGGYIHDGKLIRGASFTAGEIGHMIIKQGGTQCNCGNQGCLEAIAGKVGIIKYIERKIEEKGKTTKLDEIAPLWRKSVGASALHKAIKSKDKLVIKAVERSAEAIGVACSNVINTIGVDAVILGGGIIEELSDIYLPIIRLTIQECSMANGGSNFPVIISELGDDAVALGAAWQAVENYGNK